MPVGSGALAVLAALAALLAGSAPARAAIPPPERHPYFGYNEAWAGDLATFRLAARSGSDIARVVISWNEVEPSPGEHRWRRYDALDRRLDAAGMRPLWVLADAPCWARSVTPERCHEQGPIAYPPSPEHLQDFGRFAALIARRYPRAVAIEAWNEPNLYMFWLPRPETERAAELTAWADAAVAAVDPGMPVLLGGLAPELRFDSTEGVRYDVFIRRAYATVGPGHWDGVGIHPFPSFQRSTHYLREIRAHLRRVRAALAVSGAAGTPIWVTEIGLSTAGLRPYPPDQQAKGLARTYRALANMPDVPAVVVHRLFDQAKSLRTAESGWGVIRRSGVPKPALCALARERGERCVQR
jgi:hypothetical protein